MNMEPRIDFHYQHGGLFKEYSEVNSRFLDFKFLLKFDQGDCDIPMHQVFMHGSETYRKNWEIGLRLQHKVQGLVASRARMSAQFDPFNLTLHYPKTWENLKWLLNFPEPERILNEFIAQVEYNWSVFYYAQCTNFVRLVPCGSKSELKDYLLFVDAFARTLEKQVAKELGPLLASILQYGNFVDSRIRIEDPPHLNQHLAEVQRERNQNSWPIVCAQSHLRYPKALNERPACGMDRYEIKSFKMQYLRENPQVLSSLLNWYHSL